MCCQQCHYSYTSSKSSRLQCLIKRLIQSSKKLAAERCKNILTLQLNLLFQPAFFKVNICTILVSLLHQRYPQLPKDIWFHSVLHVTRFFCQAVCENPARVVLYQNSPQRWRWLSGRPPPKKEESASICSRKSGFFSLILCCKDLCFSDSKKDGGFRIETKQPVCIVPQRGNAAATDCQVHTKSSLNVAKQYIRK